jgi:hypothetical protein
MYIKIIKLLNYLKCIIFVPDGIYEKSKCDILFICSDADRSENVNGKAYSKILDPIYDDFVNRNYSCLHLNHPFQAITANKAWGETISATRTYLYLKIKYAVLIFFKIKTKYNNFKYEYYAILLKVFSPKIIFIISTPNELAFLCKQSGVKLIEVLHGFGYTSIPWHWDVIDQKLLPNYIISFDNISTNTFSKLQHKGVEVLQTKNLWEKRFKTIDEFKNYQGIKFSNNNKIFVLFTLTWGYANDHGEYVEYQNILENGLIPQSILDLVKDTQSSINWLFRLHPVHLRNRFLYQHHYKILNNLKTSNNNVEWVMSSNLPLLSILSFVNCHITMSSMTAYEAAANGIKTLFLCPTVVYPKLKFKDLFDQGYVNFINYKHKYEIFKYLKNVEFAKNKFSSNSNYTWNEIIQKLIK